MSKIIKIIDKKETQAQKQTNKQEKKQNKGGGSYSERVSDKWICWVFKLGFLQLICKASLIFKLNLELALSIILKERELYEPKRVVVECRCLKTWDLLSFLICSSILVLKWQVSPIYLELKIAQVNLYTRKDFQIVRDWIFIWKAIFNFE